MNIISTQVISQQNHLHLSFANAKPFRHVIIDNCFETGFCERLLQEFPDFDTRKAINEMGQVGGKAVNMAVREISNTYRALDEYIQQPEFLKLIEKITGIPDLLYDPDYIGGGTHENRHRQGLDSHVDFNYHPKTGWHRRLNLIIYLNKEWDETWGGNLELQADPWNPQEGDVKKVLPLFNRAVIFETNEYSWHGFQEIDLPEHKRDLSRRSFAIYLYTRERPSGERAASHATIYVPAGLPKDLRQNEVLSESRLLDLKKRFQRMLSQLKFLYQRELDFSSQITNLERALFETRAMQSAGLQGFALQQQVSGIWPDFWVAKQFSLRFTPTRRAKCLDLKLWVPDALKEPQTINIMLGNENQVIQVKPGKKETITFKHSFSANQAITLKVEATMDWMPSSSSNSADGRPLAWKLLSLELE